MVPTEMLEVEITESAFVLESKILSDMVESLHSHGFKVAIDDFGSGYSSLGILKDIDADVLKMDMKFLEGFEKGGRVGTIVLAMMRMAKWLKLNVVVEGVETKEQADFIKSIGGEMIQGYYYSKPLPLEDWERLLDGRQVTKKEEPFDGFSAEDTAILMGGNRLINRLLGGLCSGFGLYEYVEGRLSILRVNDGYRAIMHSGNSDISLYAGNVLDRVEERDRGAFLKNLEKAIDTGEAVDVRFHRINDKGELIYIEGIILRLNDDIKAPILCISFHDIYDKKSYDSSGKSVTDNP